MKKSAPALPLPLKFVRRKMVEMPPSAEASLSFVTACLIKEKRISELMTLVGRSNRLKFRNQVLKPLLEGGWLEMTIPNKPTSSK